MEVAKRRVSRDLLTAAYTHDVRAATGFVLYGDDVNARSWKLQFKFGRHTVHAADNSTPLHIASFCNHLEIVHILLASGADVAAKDVLGSTPLHIAAGQGHTDVVELLVRRGGASIDDQNVGGRTPLHEAAVFGREDTVAALVAFGAGVDITDNTDSTPLNLAAISGGHTPVVRELLEAGASVDAADFLCRTPLHNTARWGSCCPAIAIELLNAGADVDAKDCDGRTPYQLAVDKEHTDIANVILRAMIHRCAMCRERTRPDGRKLWRCGGDGCTRRYCSTQCQERHWKCQHKKECPSAAAG